MEHILLPEKYPGYLERFTKSEYAQEFKKYCYSTESFFAGIENKTIDAEAAAKDFVSFIGGSLPRIFGRKLALYDIRRFLFLYTVPAVLARGSQEAGLFADALIAEWNRCYGFEPLSKTDFSTLNSGFKTRIMGFDIRE